MFVRVSFAIGGSYLQSVLQSFLNTVFQFFFFLSAGAFSSFLVHVKQSFLSFPHG